MQPPFGRHLNQVPDGWEAAHDQWLALSAHRLGWFTSMQKKKALTIMEVRKVLLVVYEVRMYHGSSSMCVSECVSA